MVWYGMYSFAKCYIADSHFLTISRHVAGASGYQYFQSKVVVYFFPTIYFETHTCRTPAQWYIKRWIEFCFPLENDF